MQDRKFGLGDEWPPYLEFQPLTAGDVERREFVGRRAEGACGMCPINPIRMWETE